MQWTQWTQCPQCGLLAEVVDREVWSSTDGPVEHVHVRCVARHRFVLPAESLAAGHAAVPDSQPRQRELVRVRRRQDEERSYPPET